MRAALPLAVLLGLAALLVAGLCLLGGSAARDVPPPLERARAEHRDEPAEPFDLVQENVQGPVSAARDEFPLAPAPIEPAPQGSSERRARDDTARDDTALLFRVVDARTAAPLSTFEVRLGQRFLRPLLDDKGRIQLDFPDGQVRCAGLVEGRAGEDVQLAIAAHGYQELRVPAVYVPPGRELDLGTLRLERAARIEVRALDDQTGLPVAGARIVLLAAGVAPAPDNRPPSSAALDPFRARTDRAGQALLSSRPGEQGTLSVRHASYAALDLPLFLPLSEEHQVTVRLLAPAQD